MVVSLTSALHRGAGTEERVARVSEDLAFLRAAADRTPEFRMLIADTGMSASARRRIIETVFRPRLSPVTLHFLFRLNRINGLNQLGAIAEAFDRRIRRARGERQAEVRVARPLTEEDRSAMVGRLSTLAPRVEWTVVHDPSLLSGVAFRENDRILDFSASARLRQLRAAWAGDRREGTHGPAA
jgi:F-type H+-transporting ATPase subunit delta